MQNSNMGAAPVIVLDFDGVIIKSHMAKRRAMLAMFAEYPERSAEIDAYILSHGGVARREKLAAILELVIGTAATPALLAQYLSRYAVSLEASLAGAPLVDGVKEFVSQCSCPVYISSTAPEAEIHEQLQRSGLLHRFIAVYGARTPKAKALEEISARHRGRDIVFFGDSLSDLVAAQDAKVAFVAVTNERDNFKDIEVVKLGGFDSRAQVECSTRTALSRFAMASHTASLPMHAL
ncbi:Phosphoglycolate phosphatase, HAD superfamily [Variovorax sp. YR752]|uniref:HAD family hydrolase n=1 Tax=unclassified Variovorax TaxID=663243 RepID=UPI000BD4B891|nr:HAD family hydrolase [Variovorax sp. YR752]SOE06243.1 Phosphoglycolate phosphatase, HAD superfamily [Variovorax sp. YR752]